MCGAAPLSAQAPAAAACGSRATAACAAYLRSLDRESTLPPDSAWTGLRYLADSTEAARWFALSDVAARRASSAASGAAVPRRRRFRPKPAGPSTSVACERPSAGTAGPTG